jgi:hypothetical protein
MRRYAAIAAMLSLAALTGVAYAASATTSASISACSNARTGVVRTVSLRAHCRRGERSLSWNQQGQQGAAGGQGVAGQAGGAGAAGPAGATGAAGGVGPAGPLLTVLPSGRTETGVYEIDSRAPDTTGTAVASASISFPIALATAPSTHFVLLGTVAPAQCPGSAGTPSATAGNLCIYEASFGNTNGAPTIYDPRTGLATQAGTLGAGVELFAGSSAGNFFSDGTWAVTAP